LWDIVRNSSSSISNINKQIDIVLFYLKIFFLKNKRAAKRSIKLVRIDTPAVIAIITPVDKSAK